MQTNHVVCWAVINEAERKAQGSREAATQIFHGHAGKVREGCGSAPAYFPVSIALASAQREINPIQMSLSSHHVSIIVTKLPRAYDEVVHRMWGHSSIPHAHASHLTPREVRRNILYCACAAPPENKQVSTGAAPRPLERRPVPEGRNSGWWRQPERLFERPQGASCAEGSDQPEFQAGVTGRLPFLLLRFLCIRMKRK